MTPFEGYIPPPFGPIYPDLGAKVAKSRAAAIRDPSKNREHGEIVLEAIRRLNRASITRAISIPKPNCASGTAYTTGPEILKAVAAQNLAIICRPGLPRTDENLRHEYELAMLSKWKRGLPVPEWFVPPTEAPPTPARSYIVNASPQWRRRWKAEQKRAA